MSGRPAILLDRDGTIIVERDYLSDPTQVVLEDGAIEGLGSLAAAGWPLVVLTNQSGIARGYFDRAAADAVNARVSALLADAGINIEGWYVCPHGPNDECSCRKPRPGLAREAGAALGLDLARCWMIGDKRSDLEMAAAVGARPILVETGHGAAAREWATASKISVAANLEEAAGLILAT